MVFVGDFIWTYGRLNQRVTFAAKKELVIETPSPACRGGLGALDFDEELTLLNPPLHAGEEAKAVE
jgi:hypothetical protein